MMTSFIVTLTVLLDSCLSGRSTFLYLCSISINPLDLKKHRQHVLELLQCLSYGHVCVKKKKDPVIGTCRGLYILTV